jgi:hypothetical protein
LILGFCFTMVINHYFVYFIHFPWFINYIHASQCTKSSTHSLSNWFWSKIFYFFWNSWHCAWPQLTGLKLHKWTKNHLGIIPRCNINPTFSWWKFWNMTCAPLFWNWTLLNLVLSKKLWTLIPWWFCYKLTPFLMMKLKLYTIFFMKLKTLQFLHGFQFPMLDIIVGYVVHFIDCLLIARHII